MISWNDQFSTQILRYCVKTHMFLSLRECVKTKKHLRDCVIGYPPGGASYNAVESCSPVSSLMQNSYFMIIGIFRDISPSILLFGGKHKDKYQLVQNYQGPQRFVQPTPKGRRTRWFPGKVSFQSQIKQNFRWQQILLTIDFGVKDFRLYFFTPKFIVSNVCDGRAVV